MISMAGCFGLPKGGITGDVDEALKAWKEFAHPFEELTGLKLCSFDPGLSFRNPQDSGVGTVHLDKWVIKRINAGLAKLEEK